ncbi:hypothetical protein D3C85_788720 [compost metagenome]
MVSVSQPLRRSAGRTCDSTYVRDSVYVVKTALFHSPLAMTPSTDLANALAWSSESAASGPTTSTSCSSLLAMGFELVLKSLGELLLVS